MTALKSIFADHGDPYMPFPANTPTIDDLPGLDAGLAQRMSDRGVRILRATDAGELLPRVAANRDFFECRFCPRAERCWGLPT